VDPAEERPNAPPFRINVNPPLFVVIVPLNPLDAFKYKPKSSPLIKVPLVSTGPAILTPPRLVKVRLLVDVIPAAELR
jgi:hypothetical protein